MKMKEVCTATGLTRKTILFYEEQGFLMPRKTRINGRDYRDYGEAEVESLRDVATLRKCGFTIEEIRRMRSASTEVAAVFDGYRKRLLEQKSELDALIQIVGGMNAAQLDDLQDLLNCLRMPSQSLPLPTADREPHFQHIDALEAEMDGPPPQYKYHRDERPVVIDQDHIIIDKRYGVKKLLDETKQDMEEPPYYRRVEQKSSPLWLSVPKWLAVVPMVLFLFDCLQSSTKEAKLESLVISAVFAVLVAVLTILQHLWRKRR